MPLKIAIPEAESIRRLAAALVTAKSHGTVRDAGELDFSQTVRYYFRRIPWSGRRAVQVGLALDMSLVTVGQYFMSMDWDGLSVPVESESSERIENLSEVHSLSMEALNTPTDTVTLDGFFSDYFGH
jgi:hypothetical protein